MMMIEEKRENKLIRAKRKKKDEMIKMTLKLSRLDTDGRTEIFVRVNRGLI